MLNKTANFLDKHNLAYQFNKNSLVFYVLGGSVKYKLKEEVNGSYYLHKYFYSNKVYLLEWSKYIKSFNDLDLFISKIIEYQQTYLIENYCNKN
jgi:hypothetical protein